MGRQGGHTETYRGAEYVIDLLPKIKLEVLCADGTVDVVVGAMAESARTGNIGDGKIWTTSVGRVLRIRTGEADDDAI